MTKIEKVFGTPNPIIAMIHFPPLIGYEGFPGLNYIEEKLLKDLNILKDSGVDAVMLENNYDIPHIEFVEPEVTAMLSHLTTIASQNIDLPLGISTLWNDYKTSLGICGTTRTSFFRVPAFVDSVKTSYGIMEARAKETIDYRRNLHLEDKLIFADIQVKHSEMIDKNKTIVQSALEAIENHADALIITGKWTGDAPDLKQLEVVREAVGDFPIIIGSGATTENIKDLREYATGVIVGTAIKEGTTNQSEINLKPFEYNLNRERVLEFVRKFRQSRNV